MVRLRALELERWPLVHCSRVVFAPGHNSEWSGRFEVHSVDRSRLTSDVPVAGPGVRKEDVAELLSPLAHHHYPLIVSRPGEVLDWTGYRLELVLQDVLLVDGVPDPNLARLVRRGDVEPARAVLGHVDLARVLCVHVRVLGTVQTSHHHTWQKFQLICVKKEN